MRLHYAENNRKSATFFALQSFLKVPQSMDKQRKTSNHNGLLVFSVLVEMGGVEPPSESALTGTSPGADGYLHSRAMTQAVMLHGLVASLCMLEAKLTPVTCTT